MKSPSHNSSWMTTNFRRISLVLLALAALLSGLVVANSNASPAAAAGSASVSGTVRGGSETGPGLVGAYINFYTSEGAWLGQTETDGTGAFEVTGLDAGSYYLDVYPFEDDNYLPVDSPHFTLTASQSLTNFDIVLPAGMGVQGTLRGDPDVVLDYCNFDVYVDGYQYTGGSCDGSGNYSIVGIPPGAATIKFIAPYDANFAPVELNINANAGEVLTHNIVLPVGATISGKVSTSSAPTVGLGYAIVEAYLVGPNGNPVVMGGTNADEEGNFTIVGLGSGTYTVIVRDLDLDWAQQWWSGKSTFLTANRFSLATGQHATGKDFVLVPGSTISGVVTGFGGELDLSGAVHLYSNEGLTEGLQSYQAYRFIGSDSDGSYSFRGLPVGSYKVGFTSYSSSFSYGDGDGRLPSSEPLASQWFDGKYSFSSATPVVIGSTGQVVTGIDAVMQNPRFADVPPSSSFYTYVEWMAETGISTGTAQPSGKPLYKPSDAVSRQAMSAFLFRLSGESFTPPAEATFADVPTTSTFFQQIEWMADTGISTGTAQPSGKPLYKPSDAVSRQAMAAFLYRMSGDSFVAPTEATFADVPTTSTFFKQIEWMAANGISTGTAQPSGKPLFKPSDPVSRQAMAAFLYRYDALP